MKDRLQNVNQWKEYAGNISADFRLVDKAGREVQRQAKKGDYFKIDIPGPGSQSGDGYDWVTNRRSCEHIGNLTLKALAFGSDQRIILTKATAKWHTFTHGNQQAHSSLREIEIKLRYRSTTGIQSPIRTLTVASIKFETSWLEPLGLSLFLKFNGRISPTVC